MEFVHWSFIACVLCVNGAATCAWTERNMYFSNMCSCLLVGFQPLPGKDITNPYPLPHSWTGTKELGGGRRKQKAERERHYFPLEVATLLTGFTTGLEKYLTLKMYLKLLRHNFHLDLLIPFINTYFDVLAIFWETYLSNNLSWRTLPHSGHLSWVWTLDCAAVVKLFNISGVNCKAMRS